MTDKEQIIIDGIACKNYNNGTCQEGYCSGSVANIISCDPRNIRCDFYIDRIEEQLARKTQECEELKEKLRDLELKNTTLQNRCQQLDGSITEAIRYRKALERIEYEATEEMKSLEANTDTYGCFMEILNIINRVKREKS